MFGKDEASGFDSSSEDLFFPPPPPIFNLPPPPLPAYLTPEDFSNVIQAVSGQLLEQQLKEEGEGGGGRLLQARRFLLSLHENCRLKINMDDFLDEDSAVGPVSYTNLQ